MNNIFGIKIIENSLCERMVPVRLHEKRRTQKESYHCRIQKKWTKRFGRKVESVAYFFTDPLTGQQHTILGPRAVAMIKDLK